MPWAGAVRSGGLLFSGSRGDSALRAHVSPLCVDDDSSPSLGWAVMPPVLVNTGLRGAGPHPKGTGSVRPQGPQRHQLSHGEWLQ